MEGNEQNHHSLLLWSSHTGVVPPWRNGVLRVSLSRLVQGCERQGAAPLPGGERVAEHGAGDQDGQELPGGHDAREQQRAVPPDGVQDEQLACASRDVRQLCRPREDKGEQGVAAGHACT